MKIKVRDHSEAVDSDTAHKKPIYFQIYKSHKH